MPLLVNVYQYLALVFGQALLHDMLMLDVTEEHLGLEALDLVLRFVHLLVGTGDLGVAEAFLVISLFSINPPPLNFLILQSLYPFQFPSRPHSVHSIRPVLDAVFGRSLQGLGLLRLHLLVAGVARERALLLYSFEFVDGDHGGALFDGLGLDASDRGWSHAKCSWRDCEVVSSDGLGSGARHS